MEIEKELKLLRESWTETFDELFVLYEVAREVSSVLELDTVLGHIANHAFLLLDSEAAAVLLLDHETGELGLKALKDGRDTLPKKNCPGLKIGQGIAGRVALTGKPAIYAIESGDHHCRPDSELIGIKDPKNFLCVPIILRGGDVIGVIEVVNKKKGVFTNKDRDFLMAIANISALSVENAKVYKQLKSSESYQAQVIENLPEGFIALNNSGKVTYINAYAKKQLGLDGKSDFKGQEYSKVLENEAELAGHIEAALFHGITKRWQEISIKNTGGHAFLFTFVLRAHDNSLLGAGALIQDMVFRKT